MLFLYICTFCTIYFLHIKECFFKVVFCFLCILPFGFLNMHLYIDFRQKTNLKLT